MTEPAADADRLLSLDMTLFIRQMMGSVLRRYSQQLRQFDVTGADLWLLFSLLPAPLPRSDLYETLALVDDADWLLQRALERGWARLDPRGMVSRTPQSDDLFVAVGRVAQQMNKAWRDRLQTTGAPSELDGFLTMLHRVESPIPCGPGDNDFSRCIDDG